MSTKDRGVSPPFSSLSHPNICTLFDIGRHESTDYLVMEYVAGEDLADRLARGPLPVEQAIRLGIEIADALAAAHRSGVVHRDLKPGNVILTKSGAKLLDFGLARTVAPPVVGADAPTEHQKPLTAEGTILGTFSTWLRNSWREVRPMRAPTSSHSVRSSTRW